MKDDDLKQIVISSTTGDVVLIFMDGKCENYKLTNQPMMIQRTPPDVRQYAREQKNEAYDRMWVVSIATNYFGEDGNNSIIN